MATARARLAFSAFPSALALAIAAASALWGTTACFVTDSGRPPDLNAIYFPVGIALGPSHPLDSACVPSAGAPCKQSPKRLYLANSDFDLQFNAGTLQAYDLVRLLTFVPQYCNASTECLDPAKPLCDVIEPNDPPRTLAPSHFCVKDKGSPCPPALGLMSPADRLLYPGLCGALDPHAPPDGKGPLLVSSVQIGAFVTDVAYKDNPLEADGSPRPDGEQATRGRLFLPVRGDDTLHWIDVDDTLSGDAALDCGQGADKACDGNHRRGGNANENTRGLVLSPEPFGVAIDEKGEAVLTTHQEDGSVGLFVNRWTASDGNPVGPNLEFVLTLPDLPTGALAIAPIPEPAIVTEQTDPTRSDYVPGLPCLQYQPGFLMTFRNSAEVRLIHYFSDTARDCTDPGAGTDAGFRASEPGRPFLEASRSGPITTNSGGFDSRGIAIDAQRRQTCENACRTAALASLTAPATQFSDLKAADPTLVALRACLNGCAPISLDVYVSNRTPPTMILGHTLPNSSATSSDDVPVFYGQEPVNAGASRVIVGNVIDVDGHTLLRRIFLVCFDSRVIYVYDPVAERFETQIDTGRGPHAFAVDQDNGLGYIGHFTDSYLGVVDLNRSHVQTYGKIVLSVGVPTAPRASK